MASEAGCTTGSLTHYFANRRSLLIDSLRTAHFEAGARMQKAAEAATTPFERLEAVLMEAMPLDPARMREWRVWLAFWAESTSDSGLAKENARRYAEWRSLLFELLKPLLSDAKHAEHEVNRLIALVDGLGLQLACHVDVNPTLEARQRACESTLSQEIFRLKDLRHV